MVCIFSLHRRAAGDAEGMCSFTWLGDDNQVKTPAFGKVIDPIVCGYIWKNNRNYKAEKERNYFTSRFLRIDISRFVKRKFSACSAPLR